MVDWLLLSSTWSTSPHHLLPIVTSCHDPGDVEHSRRLISSPKFPVGATVQYICDQGFVLTGSAILTCHDRQASTPKWSDRAPKCLRKCQMGRRGSLWWQIKYAASGG